MQIVSLLLCRSWLTSIALEYGSHIGSSDTYAAQKATRDAKKMLSIAPWHFRFLVGGVEIVASLWCAFYRLFGSNIIRELSLFEKTPIVAAPLLRLYRSLIALSWFEQPTTASYLSLTESAEEHQTRFRKIRNNA